MGEVDTQFLPLRVDIPRLGWPVSTDLEFWDPRLSLVSTTEIPEHLAFAFCLPTQLDA